jgi:hypothetical protein
MELPISRVTFIKNPHSYIDENGVILMGVTSLMKKHGLTANYDNIPEEILIAAARKGSIVHEDCELGVEFDSYNTPQGKAYGKLLKEKGIEVIATEYLVSDNEIIATQIDVVFKYNSKLYVGDLKNTQKLHTEPLKWQLSIGQYLFEKQTGIKVEGRAAFWFNRNKQREFNEHSICEFIEFDEIPKSEINALFDAESLGMIYEPVKNDSIELSNKANTAIAKITQIENAIIEHETKLKDLKASKDKYSKIILDTLEANAIKSWETDKMKITLVADTETNTIDTKKLKEKYPKIAKELSKISIRKGYLKITLKK